MQLWLIPWQRLFVGISQVNRLDSYIGTRLHVHSSSVFGISGILDVKLYGINNILISSYTHLSLIIAAVRQQQLRYVIVLSKRFKFIRALMWFSRDYLHLWHSWGIVLIKKVTVLSYFPREETRVIALDEYRRRTICSNHFPRDACVQHHISFWK